MGLFSAAAIDKINAVAAKSKAALAPPKSVNSKSVNKQLNEISAQVLEYFKDSTAILISSEEELHDYVDAIIQYGYAGIDTETTGLDRVKDYIVGASLYVPGRPECYIPIKHLIPIFEEPYKGQLTYKQVEVEFQRIAEAGVKLIFANADFDLAMIFKDIKVDFCQNCYFDVITAWRCLKENELHNDLKSLYNKYVLKGKGNPKKFTDFFSPALFPYCKPEVAKLYAANDAKITFDLFLWELPYVTKDHPKCKRNHLERIADLVWNIEIPMITVCQMMHRTGVYLDSDIYSVLQERYRAKYNAEMQKLRGQVQDILDNTTYVSKGKRPFLRGSDFSPTSTQHVQYLCYTILNLPVGKDGQTTSKEVLATYNVPVINQILKVRSLSVLINTFVEKLPNSTTPDNRIHAQFRSIGADTGRMSSAEPNCQNIPSHATDIRHMFRATPEDTYQVEQDVDGAGDLSLVLPGYHMLETPTGTVKVHELKVSDIVIACDEANNSVSCQVTSNVELTPGNHELKLNVIGGTEYER